MRRNTWYNPANTVSPCSLMAMVHQVDSPSRKKAASRNVSGSSLLPIIFQRHTEISLLEHLWPSLRWRERTENPSLPKSTRPPHDRGCTQKGNGVYSSFRVSRAGMPPSAHFRAYISMSLCFSSLSTRQTHRHALLVGTHRHLRFCRAVIHRQPLVSLRTFAEDTWPRRYHQIRQRGCEWAWRGFASHHVDVA